MLPLFVSGEENAFLVERLKVDHVVEAETPCHSNQVLQSSFFSWYQFSKVAEQDDQKLRNGSTLLDESQIFFVSLIIRL